MSHVYSPWFSPLVPARLDRRRLAVPVDPRFGHSGIQPCKGRKKGLVLHQFGILAEPLHPALGYRNDEDEPFDTLVPSPLRPHLFRGHLAAVIDLDVAAFAGADHRGIGFGPTDFCTAFEGTFAEKNPQVRDTHFVFDFRQLARPAVDNFWPPRVPPLDESDYSDTSAFSLPDNPLAGFLFPRRQRSAGE